MNILQSYLNLNLSKLNSHDAVVTIENPVEEGDANGELALFEQFVDCVIKLEVSKEDSVITIGSLLISLLFPSDIVIDILRPPVMFVS